MYVHQMATSYSPLHIYSTYPHRECKACVTMRHFLAQTCNADLLVGEDQGWVTFTL